MGLLSILFDHNQAEVGALERGQQVLGGSVKTLETGQQVLEGSVKTLEAGQQVLEGSVKTLEAGQQVLEGSVKTLETGQQVLEGSVKTLETGQQVLDGNVSSILEKIADQEQAMAICAVVSVGIVMCLAGFFIYQAVQHARENASSADEGMPKSNKTNVSITGYSKKEQLID